eukprot:15411370-Alexandrium_andersonii.AAC.1
MLRLAPNCCDLAGFQGGAWKPAKSQQFGARRNMGRLHMAEMPRREASPPPQRPLEAVSGPPPD